ncbi:MAG: hypothetical protein AAF840_00395 [Bacteroidota bacterium]
MQKLIIGIACLLVLLLPAACTYDQLALVETCDNNLIVTITDQTASACGLASGSITASVTGAEAGVPITFSLNGTTPQDLATFTDLAAGSYTLVARQGVCEASVDITLENAEGLNASAEASPADCGTSNGSIFITATDASGAVAYSIDGGTPQTSATFTGLAPGTYNLTAEDEIGCIVTLEVIIPSSVAYAQIEAIVTSSCAISGCHAGNVSPDFRDKATIISRSGRIASRTGNASMPPPSSGIALTQQEIEAIACWVADGAPE